MCARGDDPCYPTSSVVSCWRSSPCGPSRCSPSSSSSCRPATSSRSTSAPLQSSGSHGLIRPGRGDARRIRPRPAHDVQYFKWMGKMLQGNFGMSLAWNRPVIEVIGDRLWLTMVVSLAAIMLTWVVALPIGIYSAVRQYSLGDYVFTFIGFIGLAVPNFLLALVLMYLGFKYFGMSIGGLFSPEYGTRPGAWPRSSTCCKHLILPPSSWAWPARRSSSASCAPTCWTSCASPTSSRRAPRACPRRGSSSSTRCASRLTPSPAPSATSSPTWCRAASSSRWCSACPRWGRCC